MKYELDTELMNDVCKALQKAQSSINEAIERLEDAQKSLAFDDIVEKTTDILYEINESISVYTVPYEDWDFMNGVFLKLFCKRGENNGN